MKHEPEREQFNQEVLPAELEEISKRRARLGLPAVTPEPQASTRMGLVGLALSGGGIRSATLSLGVVQALAKLGLLRTVDYLSTVSGGGFMGSCLSSILNSADTSTEQEHFPLQFQVGMEEPLAVGHLRDSSRYLAPGGMLDKLRIPALILRGVISNLLIFLLLIFLLVLLTEVVYEVGQRVDLPFGQLILVGGGAFLVLVVVFPIVSHLLRGRATWEQRNTGELIFSIALVAVLVTAVMIPMFILVDQAIDQSWGDIQEGVAGNVLRPFEARDLVQWMVLLGVLTLVMFAGRASQKVSRLGGKVVLLTLGLMGPALLGLIYLGLVVVEIDSPYISPDQLFSLDSEHADQLDESTIDPALRDVFRKHRIRLSGGAEVIVLREDVRWLIRDGRFAYELEREQNEISVYPDFADALGRGQLPRELVESMGEKGYAVNLISHTPPTLRENRFVIDGSHVYWVDHDEANDTWSMEQIVDVVAAVEAVRSASAEVRSGTLIHEDASLSDDDAEQAIRFVEEGNPHDVVLLVDNSRLPFEDREAFLAGFEAALEKTLQAIRATVRLAAILFDEDIHTISSFTPLSGNNKQDLLENLFGRARPGSVALNFQGELSNMPAALVRAMQEVTEGGRRTAKKSIVLISDGTIDVTGTGHDPGLGNWVETEFAQEARDAGVQIFGIALSDDARFELFQKLTSETGGTFYPVFKSAKGVTAEDLLDAMQKLRDSAGGRLTTPLRSVTITDQDRGVRYTLTRSEGGIRIQAVLGKIALTAKSLDRITPDLRELFEDQGIELSEGAAIARVGKARWEIRDPYSYTLSRVGRNLTVEPTAVQHEDNWLVAATPSSLWDGTTDWVFVTVLAILLIHWLVVDVNAIAIHRFYRDRLSKAYLMRRESSGAIGHNDRQKLSTLNTEGSAAPYHLINVALNLQGSRNPSLRGRNSGFFVFAKRFSGSLETGFLETERMEHCDPDLSLGTAMAISGAAASPNRGATTFKPLVFIMTLLNVRLGYWVPNPRAVVESSWLTRLGLRRAPGPKYLLKESLGLVHERDTFVNVSDGGHIENLGIYELLRRRCRCIIAVDGGADPGMTFGDLVKLLLYARIDMGIEIELDLDPIRPNEAGETQAHWAVGTIHYAGGETGHLLYIKSSVTGDEYEYVREYRSRNPDFPHESTAEQFFDENRFEAYRALGYHIGEQLFDDQEVVSAFGTLRPAS